MKQYLDMMRHIRDNGVRKMDRTGTGTIAVFGYQMRFDLQVGFPLLTTKKIYLKGVVHELLWFLKGETNIKYLVDNGVHIWDDWADENGDLGPVYGSQWRSWRGAGESYTDSDALNVTVTVDQIANVVERIKQKPDDRRLIVSAWNPAEIDQMKLPPCHCLFQFFTRELTLEQRVERCDSDQHHLDVPRYDHDWLDAVGVPRRFLDCQLYQRSPERLH